MVKEQRRYLSYLLRLWPADVEGRVVWRASIESASNGERLGFTDLDTLYTYLQEQATVIGDALSQGRRREDETLGQR